MWALGTVLVEPRNSSVEQAAPKSLVIDHHSLPSQPRSYVEAKCVGVRVLVLRVVECFTLFQREIKPYFDELM